MHIFTRQWNTHLDIIQFDHLTKIVVQHCKYRKSIILKYFSIFINIVKMEAPIKIRCQNLGICLTFIICKTYLSVYEYIFFCIYFFDKEKVNVQHKYFYYLEAIYYGTLTTHSMSLSFAPILEMKRSKHQFHIYNLLHLQRGVNILFVTLLKRDILFQYQ